MIQTSISCYQIPLLEKWSTKWGKSSHHITLIGVTGVNGVASDFMVFLDEWGINGGASFAFWKIKKLERFHTVNEPSCSAAVGGETPSTAGLLSFESISIRICDNSYCIAKPCDLKRLTFSPRLYRNSRESDRTSEIKQTNHTSSRSILARLILVLLRTSSFSQFPEEPRVFWIWRSLGKISVLTSNE